MEKKVKKPTKEELTRKYYDEKISAAFRKMIDYVQYKKLLWVVKKNIEIGNYSFALHGLPVFKKYGKNSENFMWEVNSAYSEIDDMYNGITYDPNMVLGLEKPE